jgi:glycosyltransferase involved in cell wall biosynthesis
VRNRTLFVPADAPGDDHPLAFGMLTSFPPTACGIATFSAALAAGLLAGGSSVDVVRAGSGPPVEHPLVGARMGAPRTDAFEHAIEVLDRCDVAIVQHEYGIYGGPDGADVLGVMAAITVPTILVAHTVVRHPSAHQRSVLERACDLADLVVVMTNTARIRLLEGFTVDAGKIHVIPHGAATPVTTSSSAAERPTNSGARLLTWGLLGPGKGIEWAIDAVADLTDIRPRPHYIVAGATHPKVLERDGEDYRRMLSTRAWRTGAAPHVTFDGEYRDLASLTALIASVDLVVLPYDSQDQVTSGVLVDAVAAGRPVVSTAFPHAVELLASGAGLVVPQRDPDALAEAIRTVVTDAHLADSMAAEARRLAPGLSWDAIAARYRAAADELVTSRQAVRT